MVRVAGRAPTRSEPSASLAGGGWSPPRPPVAGGSGRRVELLDPLDDGRWEAFVAGAPGAGVFHHRAWLALLHRTYGYPITACCVVDASGTVRAGAPLALVAEGLRRPRLVCLPFSEHCAPLPAPDEDPVLAHELVQALEDLRRTMSVRAELRGPVAPHRSAHVSARYHAHHIPLPPDVDSVARRFARPMQSSGGQHRPPGEDLVVERRTDERALAEFHCLSVAAHRRRGVPPRPKGFILGFAHLFDRGLGFVLLGRSGGRALAGAVFLCFNDTIHYECGASEAGAPPEWLRDVLLLEAIRWGSAAGMHSLDLGRTAVGCKELREVKLSWQAEERLLAFHEISDEPPRPPGRAFGSWAAPLIRHAPPILSRAIGEPLYRRAGC